MNARFKSAALRQLRRLCAGAAIVLTVAWICMAILLWMVGRPDATRWTHEVTWMGLKLHLPVAAGVRAATSPLGGAILDGRRFDTRFGRIAVRWDEPAEQLVLHCAPCRIQAPALSTQLVEVAAVRISLRRSLDRVWGEVQAGALKGRWQGRLTDQDLAVQLDVDESPMADFYGVFARALPELRHARIDGRFAARATLVWPAGGLRLEPRWQLDRVEGLGTQALRGVAPAVRCPDGPPPPAVRLPFARQSLRPASQGGRAALHAAVVAAEDQRFYEHRGIDQEEMAASLAANHALQGIARGASTLNQQLAKLLFTGSERTHLRKLREALYAVEMEDTLGKAQVLALYVGAAPWGPGICGADAAARHYFAKPVGRLSVLEAAWLAALLREPAAGGASGNAPAHASESAAAFLARTQWIVRGMAGVPRAERSAALQALAALVPAQDSP
jgi:hypothetical protein